MNLVRVTQQKLKMAIHYNEVIDYLEGTGLYKICSDPRDVTSLHAFNFSIECYDKLVDCLEKCLIYGHIRRFAD